MIPNVSAVYSRSRTCYYFVGGLCLIHSSVISPLTVSQHYENLLAWLNRTNLPTLWWQSTLPVIERQSQEFCFSVFDQMTHNFLCRFEHITPVPESRIKNEVDGILRVASFLRQLVHIGKTVLRKPGVCGCRLPFLTLYCCNKPAVHIE